MKVHKLAWEPLQTLIREYRFWDEGMTIAQTLYTGVYAFDGQTETEESFTAFNDAVDKLLGDKPTDDQIKAWVKTCPWFGDELTVDGERVAFVEEIRDEPEYCSRGGQMWDYTVKAYELRIRGEWLTVRYYVDRRGEPVEIERFTVEWF